MFDPHLPNDCQGANDPGANYQTTCEDCGKTFWDDELNCGICDDCEAVRANQ